MAADRKSASPLPLRSAVANLLRAARSELDDARLVLRGGHRRNAAFLVAQALAHIVESLAASEHGWPLVEWNAGLRAIPEANPFQPELADINAAIAKVTRSAVRADGEAVQAPDASEIAGLLERTAAMLKAAADAFEADLDGTGPAGTVGLIREEVNLKPIEPRAPPGKPLTRAPAPHPAAAWRSQRGPGVAPAPREEAKSAAQPGKSIVRTQSPGPRRSTERKKVTGSIVLPPDRGIATGPITSAADAAEPVPAGHEFRTPERPSRAHQVTDVTSAVFWSLADRWRLEDLEALHLIGHAGGLTKKGTRPRFRVVGEEAELFHYLQEIDAALRPLNIEPAGWIRKPIGEAPFEGASPIEHIARNSIGGARDVMHRILAMSLLPAATKGRRPGKAS